MAPIERPFSKRSFSRRWSTYAVAPAVFVAVLGLQLARAGPSAAAEEFLWPVTGPVIRGFEGPATPFSAGHRGIDIAAGLGTPVRASESGVVTFAGPVAGSLFLTIDHGLGIRTSYSWLSQILVRKGAAVTRGQVVALTGHGHPDVVVPHLHFGIRVDGVYVDPLLFLEPASVVDLIRLAPLTEQVPVSPPPTMGAFGLALPNAHVAGRDCAGPVVAGDRCGFGIVGARLLVA